MRLIGYARVSTEDQHPEIQIDQLVKAGCALENIYTHTASGASWERPPSHAGGENSSTIAATGQSCIGFWTSSKKAMC
jgi:Resolvase, N terminal domain